MIGDTFQYIKQVGYVLSARENIKDGDFVFSFGPTVWPVGS